MAGPVLLRLLAVDVRGRRRVYSVRVWSGGVYSTIAGPVRGRDILEAGPGGVVEGVRGRVYVLPPTWLDLLEGWAERRTQVVYPKDSAYIGVRLGLGSGSVVLEAGLGSGFLTSVLLALVCPGGRVIGFEARADHLEAAVRNVGLTGFRDCLDARLGDVAEAGLEEESVDAVVLDLPDPWRVLPAVRPWLRPGRPAAVFLPTSSQVDRLLAGLGEGWVVESVEELLRREWEPSPGALRPSPRMIGHTGFIVFLRAVRGS